MSLKVIAQLFSCASQDRSRSINAQSGFLMLGIISFFMPKAASADVDSEYS